MADGRQEIRETEPARQLSNLKDEIKNDVRIPQVTFIKMKTVIKKLLQHRSTGFNTNGKAGARFRRVMFLDPDRALSACLMDHGHAVQVLQLDECIGCTDDVCLPVDEPWPIASGDRHSPGFQGVVEIANGAQ